MSVSPFEIPIQWLFFFLNWRRTALQHCVGFCPTTTWISRKYTRILSLLNLPLTQHPTPLGCHRALGWALCVIRQLPTSYVLYYSVYMSMLLSPLAPSTPSPAVSTSLLSMSASLFLPCKQVHQYHFSRLHLYVLIYDICFSLSDLLHSV